MSKAAVSEIFLADSRSSSCSVENNIPTSFRHAKELLKEFLAPLEVFHACINDCIVYTKQNKFAERCPECGTARLNENNKPHKTFPYYPLGPRLVRLLQSNEYNVAKIKPRIKSVISDIQDTYRWNVEWFGENGLFQGSTGIALSFCTDGMNPHDDSPYSMWPMMVQVLNYAPEFRKSSSGIKLVGIIPGNSDGKEPRSLEPYLEVFVSELLELSNGTIYTGNTGVPVQVKLVQYVLDFPAIAKVFHVQAQGGLKACPWCLTSGFRCPYNKKTVYLDNRRFLSADSPLRESTGFHHQKKELQQAPRRVSVEENKEIRSNFEALTTNASRSRHVKESGIKGEYAFMKLPYHGFQNDYQPDAMHTVRRVAEAVISWLTQPPMRQTKAEKVGPAETVSRQVENVESILYVLSKADKQIANARVESIYYPSGFTGRRGKVFSTNPNATLRNHHGWQEFITQNVWIFCLRNLLPQKQQRSVTLLFSTLRHVFEKSIARDALPELKETVGKSLALLERDLPSCVFNITTHLLHHLVENIDNFGPMHASWMYPLERMNSWLSRRVKSRSNVEMCVMETYQILDWVVYCQVTNKFPKLSLEKIVLFTEDSEEEDQSDENLSFVQPLTVEGECLKKKMRCAKNSKGLRVLDGTYVKLLSNVVVHIIGIYKSGEQTRIEYCECLLQRDVESGLSFVYEESVVKQCNENFIGDRLVFSRENETVWILSITTPLVYPWLDEHIAG